MLKLKLGIIKSRQSDIFKFEMITDDFITSRPTLMDPYDRATIFLNMSTIPHTGEGLFARRDIPPYQLVVTYAGFKAYEDDDLYLANMTKAERFAAHKNLISYNDDYALDIPPHISDAVVYRASLGHKVTINFAMYDQTRTRETN